VAPCAAPSIDRSSEGRGQKMKLRIWRNSLRLRLSQSEVAQLAAGSRLEESLDIPGNSSLRYAVEPAEESAMGARFAGNLLQIFVPGEMARTWAASQDVGLYTEYPTKIAVEKDFRCLTGREAEAEADTFPNPAQTC